MCVTVCVQLNKSSTTRIKYNMYSGQWGLGSMHSSLNLQVLQEDEEIHSMIIITE